MKYQLHLFAMLSAMLLNPTIASAQSIEFSLTGQPKSFVVESRPFVVEGYGAARLGMTVNEVKAAIAKDYPSALPTLKDEVDPLARTRGLAVVVPALAPVQSLGPATISYIFGATTQRLISINVYWLLDAKADKTQREKLVARWSLRRSHEDMASRRSGARPMREVMMRRSSTYPAIQ